MSQSTLNIKIDIYINDSSIQEANGQNQDSNICCYSNYKSINPNDYKIEEELFLNNYYSNQKSFLTENENNNEKTIEKITKTNIKEENTIPFKIREENISFPTINKNSNEEILKTETIKIKKDLNEKTHLGRKRRNDFNNGEHNKYSDDN